MFRTLVIGYGNIDRADDGVAYHVINDLRRRLERDPLREDDTGLEELGAEVDTIFLLQLTPELMEVITVYDRIIFVDAHVAENIGDLYCTSLSPQEDASLTFTHHISPALLLLLMRTLYHCQPGGYMVSIRGYDFDFHRSLSDKTRAMIAPAIDHIMQMLAV
jgi:hydrogenase maturation protease